MDQYKNVPIGEDTGLPLYRPAPSSATTAPTTTNSAEALPGKSIETRIADLKNLVAVQCSDGNWNYDDYMRGMANGLLVAMSCFDDSEPKFKEAQKECISDRTAGAAMVQIVEEIAGVNMPRLLRNLEETSYNEGSIDLACRLTDCHAVIKALLAARPSAAQVSVPEGWQPIETAPQDGYILVHEDGAFRALLRINGAWHRPAYPAIITHPFGEVIVGDDANRLLPTGYRLELRDGCCENPTE